LKNGSEDFRRAAISIPSNIAEGGGRKSAKEFINFLYISLGSAVEIESQLIISERLNYFAYTKSQEKEELQSIIRILTGPISIEIGEPDLS